MKEQISELLANHTALPVLFVGSGLTRRYLGLPSWEGLLKKYCVKPFEYYNDKATRICRDDPDMRLPTAADLIEADFNEEWYTSDRYAESRLKHKSEMENKISPFKICIAEYFRENSNNILDQYKDEIESFKRIGNKNISCIVTTNYDCFLEHCFGENQFTTYIGQNDLLFSTTLEVGELYKIHGCCTKPESIVINSDDYSKFAKKSAYLSSKILTMFLERPIIFLGYSINDWDINRILDSIADCLENDQLNQLSERLIFIERNRHPEKLDQISERRITTQSGKTISMKNVSLTDYASLYDAIFCNQVKYDIRVLRKIKSQLYELVQENKPSEKLYIATNIEDEQEDVDFVVGVGVYGKFGRVGYRGIKPEELYLYVIGKSELQYDTDMLLKEAIPAMYNGRTIFPVWKFISECGSKECINEKVLFSYKKKFKDFASQVQREQMKKSGYIDIGKSIVNFYHENGVSKTSSKIPMMNPLTIDPDDLLNFILTALENEPFLLPLEGKRSPSSSQFKKCISIWDYLKFSKMAEAKIKEFN